MIQKRKKYSKEFKEDAVRLIEESGLSVKEISEDLGVSAHLLYKWRRAYLSNGAEAFTGNGDMNPVDKEKRRLEREISDLKLERDILKKALGIFSKHPK